METDEIEPLLLRVAGAQAVERAAAQLRRLLHQAAARLHPFPPFPGAFFTNAIEIEPRRVDPEHGCIVVCEDGELYELEMGIDLESMTLGLVDPTSLRSEQLKPMDLPAAGYIDYAYCALDVLVERLLEQEDGQ